MASKDMSNIDISAMVPEVWTARLQVPLFTTLVAMETANTDLASEISEGDTVHKGYLDRLSADDYTAGSAMAIQQYSATDDTLSIDKRKVVPFYIDDVDQLQTKPDYFASLADDAAFQLRDAIDSDVLGEVTAGTEFGESTASTGNYITGSTTQTITATSGNIDNVFVDARRALREANVSEAGDWVAIVEPKIASKIELMTTNAGFNVADATLRNGFAGNYLGFNIYISNNLPADHAYVGKNRSIDLVLQKDVGMQVRNVSDKLGTNFAAWTVYGYTVFNYNTSRFLDVDITT